MKKTKKKPLVTTTSTEGVTAELPAGFKPTLDDFVVQERYIAKLLRELNELKTAKPTGDSIYVHVPDATRADLIRALVTMPDEAFMWFVLACPQSAMTHGGNAQIWPDGMGGFSSESRASVEALRAAVEVYLKTQR